MAHRLGILIAMCALMSCSDPQGPGQPSQYAHSYFPLALGNTWYYNSYHVGHLIDSSQYDDLREIVSMRYLGKMEFFLMRRTRFGAEGSIRLIQHTTVWPMIPSLLSKPIDHSRSPRSIYIGYSHRPSPVHSSLAMGTRDQWQSTTTQSSCTIVGVRT
jgi:hypothetical protein